MSGAKQCVKRSTTDCREVKERRAEDSSKENDR